jgi:deoxyribodipyrimidine photo-lyase
MSKAIYWFRKDLRIRNNYNFAAACEENEQLLPVFILDEKYFIGHFKSGLPKMSQARKTFVYQCLLDLKMQLKERGSNLLILTGEPIDVLTKLAAKYQVSTIYTSDEPGYDEEKQLRGLKAEIDVVSGYDNFLYLPDGLPFSADATPEIFTKFRGKAEKYGEIFDEIESYDIPPIFENDENITSEEHLLVAASEVKLRFNGGESNAWKRLNYYFEESELLSKYKETRNGLLGDDYSSKFSPWLAWGCISPISIYHRVKEFEAQFGSTQNTYWLIFELLWRDFFRYISLKHRNQLFTSGGIKNANFRDDFPTESYKKFELWCKGETGYPFVDANMRELSETGFMSNRGRQNVASFLVKDLNIDWRLGAAWFEHHLLDYDVNSNYGNWLYVAGLGNDPREGRYFNVLIQGERYDADAAYVKHYFPQLKNLEPKKAHQPYLAPEVDYPKPLVKVKFNS